MEPGDDLVDDVQLVVCELAFTVPAEAVTHRAFCNFAGIQTLRAVLRQFVRTGFIQHD